MTMVNGRRRALAAERTLVPGRPADYPEFSGDVQERRGQAVGPVRDADGKMLLKSMTFAELEDWVVNTLGHKKYRARQLWGWMYKEERYASSFEEMTDLAKSFRAELERVARVDSIAIDTVHQSEDGTRKILFRLRSGGVVESVLIPAEGRSTLCFSSQKGCAFNCQVRVGGRRAVAREARGPSLDAPVLTCLSLVFPPSRGMRAQFCFTGRSGFSGNLTQAEIVDQVVLAKRFFEGEGKISNLVAMGQGEPLANYENLLRALGTILDKDGMNMSHNKVTVSTVGLVPEIRRFVRESKANLAVSLHSANDKVRSWIMPVNRKYPLNELIGALRDEFPRDNARQQKVFFEYVMLKGVNDSLQDARELLRLVSGVPCKINLIQFNTHDGSTFEASSPVTMLAFQDFLVKKGLTVTIRASRGEDKMMACGQLGEAGPARAPRMRVPDEFLHAVRTPSGEAADAKRRTGASAQ